MAILSTHKKSYSSKREEKEGRHLGEKRSKNRCGWFEMPGGGKAAKQIHAGSVAVLIGVTRRGGSKKNPGEGEGTPFCGREEGDSEV